MFNFFNDSFDSTIALFNGNENISPDAERFNNLVETINNNFDDNATRELSLDSIIPSSSNGTETIQLETSKNVHMSIQSPFRGYNLVQKLGKGGFSAVCLVKKMETNELFAAKIFPMKEIMKSDEFKYSLNEINMLKMINHQYIIKCYDSFTIKNDKGDEYFIIILEYCEGCSLFEYMFNNTISEAFLREILFKISLAIDYLHENGFSHGDIKPENILLDSNLNPKLIDFGFAKRCEISNETRKCYTLEYASPELLRKGSYDPKCSDIWSLGVTFYVIETKNWPFLEKPSIKSQILKGKIDFKPESDLQKLVLKCLQKDPKKRITIKGILRDDYFQKN